MSLVVSLKADFDNVFVVVNKQQETGKFFPIYKSECIRPVNRQVNFRDIILDSLNLSNINQPIMFVLFHNQQTGVHPRVGSAIVELYRFQSDQNFKVKMDRNGKFRFSNCAIENRVTFLDYIVGGCEIGVHVAIDFTLSNRKPTDPKSLHYLPPDSMQNQYTDAIVTICNILQSYDSD